MISRGGAEKENAEQVVNMLRDYIKQSNMTEAEYAQVVKADLRFQLLYKKLAEQEYQGSSANLMAAIERKYEQANPK